MNEAAIKSHLRSAALEDMKAKAREPVKVRVATCIEKQLQVWLEPKESADVLAGMLSSLALSCNVSLPEVQALLAELYTENQKRKAQLEAARRDQPQVATSAQ